MPESENKALISDAKRRHEVGQCSHPLLTYSACLAHDLAVALEKEFGLSHAFEVAARNTADVNKALRQRVEELQNELGWINDGGQPKVDP